MADIVVLRPKHEVGAAVRVQLPYAATPNDVLMQQLVDTLIELQRRSDQAGFAGIALYDAGNRLWSMRALVNLCKNYFTHIAHRAES